VEFATTTLESKESSPEWTRVGIKSLVYEVLGEIEDAKDRMRRARR